MAKLVLVRQVEDQKEDMTTLQERQKDLFETIKSLEKDIQVMNDACTNARGHPQYCRSTVPQSSKLSALLKHG